MAGGFAIGASNWTDPPHQFHRVAKHPLTGFGQPLPVVASSSTSVIPGSSACTIPSSSSPHRGVVFPA